METKAVEFSSGHRMYSGEPQSPLDLLPSELWDHILMILNSPQETIFFPHIRAEYSGILRSITTSLLTIGSGLRMHCGFLRGKDSIIIIVWIPGSKIFVQRKK